MKKFLISALFSVLFVGVASAEDVKIGVLLGFTGPIESLTPNIAGGAELAMKEVTDSGKFMGGSSVTPVRADSACEATAATAAAERLVTSDGVAGIVGAACSGATTAALQNVALPNGVVLISPSSTSPALSTVEDNGLFFRTAPSDARQGVVMADIIKELGVSSVAVTYTNNDYGKGLADSFEAAFKAAGGEITNSVPHDDGKGDYSSEVAALAAAGGEMLVIVGYVDQGGSGIIRNSLDTGAFDRFHFPDGMIGAALSENFGSELDGSSGQAPGTDSPGNSTFQDLAGDTFDASSPFTGEAYDAAALIMLAMQKANSINSANYKGHIMDIANAPGEEIFPGDLGKALDIIASGGDVNYVGASAVELIGPGESSGSFGQYEFKGGKYEIIGYR